MKEDLKLLGLLAAVGALIGVANMLKSDEKLTIRKVAARAILNGGLGVAAAAIVLLIPSAPFAAQVGLGAALASLGVSALEALFNKAVSK